MSKSIRESVIWGREKDLPRSIVQTRAQGPVEEKIPQGLFCLAIPSGSKAQVEARGLCVTLLFGHSRPRLDLDALEAAPEHDVDSAADCVPAVQGGGGVAQYLDAFDGRDGECVEIEGRIGYAAPVDENRGAAVSEDEWPGNRP